MTPAVASGMNHPRRVWLVCALAAGILGLGVSALLAQSRLAPTHRNVAYHTQDNSQRLDVYLAETDHVLPAIIYMHGGGWRGGSKSSVPSWLIDGVLEKRWSVVAVEYRFSNIQPHPAQVEDCLRAVQFTREQASQWHIDSRRLAVTGGSAGGHLSLWIALHDDIANVEASDPVERHSSRVACAVSFAGPTDWQLLKQLEHHHPAYRQLLGYEPGTPADQMDAEKLTNVSPITFVSHDDPPVMQIHGDNDDIVPIEHARRLDQRLKAAQVPSELVVISGANHSVAAAAHEVSAAASKFVARVFQSLANQ